MRRREDELDIQAIIREISSLYPTRTFGETAFGTQADLIVNKGDKRIAIELKNRPITLLDIRRLLQTRYSEKIIAVTSDALLGTSESVIDYAERTRIRLCNIDELVNVINRL